MTASNPGSGRFLTPLLASLALVASAAAQTTSPGETLKSATKTANDIRNMTGAKPPAKELPSGDPCGILPQGEVQRIFPGVKGGERSKRLEEYGTTECGYKDGSGQVVLVVQESYNGGSSAKEDARGMAQGFVDPIKGDQALKNVRIETFPALGDAAAFVEKADPKRGILGDGALMELRKGRHNISIGSSDLPRRDRTAALKAFEDLGRVAVKRL